MRMGTPGRELIKEIGRWGKSGYLGSLLQLRIAQGWGTENRRGGGGNEILEGEVAGLIQYVKGKGESQREHSKRR